MSYDQAHADTLRELTTERTRAETAEAERDMWQERTATMAASFQTQQARAETAEATVARMEGERADLRQRIQLLAVVLDDKVGLAESDNAPAVAGILRRIAGDVRALLEGGRYSEDEHGCR